MLNSIAGKTYGTVSAEIQKEMTGPEFVRGLVDGTLPLNTIAEALGYDVTEVGRGRVVVIAKPNGTHLNPTGTVHGGLSATLLDSCMGLAIHSTLERGVGSTTLEFKISLLRPITPGNWSRHGRRPRPQLRPPCRNRGRADHRSGRTVARPWHDNVPNFSKLSYAGC